MQEFGEYTHQKAAGTDHVVFTRRGNRYTLTQVWVANSAGHIDIHLTQKQKNAMKERLDSHLAVETISLPLMGGTLFLRLNGG